MTGKTGNVNEGSGSSAGTGASAGLSDRQVADRRNQYGFNDITEEKKHPVLKFLSYFWGPIPWMIEAAAVLSAVISHWEDFFVILLLLMINAVVGFFQERKAENAIELLKKRLAPNARVLRNGTWQELPARELVPGDTVHVRLGDIVPADLLLVRGSYLSLDESALTGESLPVEKKAGDTAYSGSIIRQGEMDATVTATGTATYFGKTTRLLQQKPPRSHFQQAVVRIGNYLIILAVVLVSLVSVISFLRSEPLAETLQFALVLVVAAIPAALPAVLTVTLAVGAMALSKKEAIVSRLTAIEEMAGMDILCSDKTGTITQNAISIGGIRAFGGVTDEDIITAGALASRIESNDPIDAAILSRYASLSATGGRQPFETLSFIPFDPVKKFSMATVRDSTGRSFDVAKGAPQAITQLAKTPGHK